jgi:hypothetical protein
MKWQEGGEGFTVSSLICTLHKCLQNQIKKDKMSGACGTYREGDRCPQQSFKSLEGRDTSVVLGVYGRIIIKCILSV